MRILIDCTKINHWEIFLLRFVCESYARKESFWNSYTKNIKRLVTWIKSYRISGLDLFELWKLPARLKSCIFAIMNTYATRENYPLENYSFFQNISCNSNVNTDKIPLHMFSSKVEFTVLWLRTLGWDPKMGPSGWI